MSFYLTKKEPKKSKYNHELIGFLASKEIHEKLDFLKNTYKVSKAYIIRKILEEELPKVIERSKVKEKEVVNVVN